MIDDRINVLDGCDRIANRVGRPFAWWRIETESVSVFHKHFWLLDTQQKLGVLRRVEASCDNDTRANKGGPDAIADDGGPPDDM